MALDLSGALPQMICADGTCELSWRLADQNIDIGERVHAILVLMMAKSKTAREREAVTRLAELMYESLSKLPESEQRARMAKIEKLNNSRKSSPKRPSTVRNLPETPRAATVRRKRAHL